MDGQKGKALVEIFGETYSLRGDDDPEAIVRIAEFVDDRMKKVARENLRLAPTKVAVLVALNIAEEYLRLEQDYKQLVQMVQDKK